MSGFNISVFESSGSAGGAIREFMKNSHGDNFNVKNASEDDKRMYLYLKMALKCPDSRLLLASVQPGETGINRFAGYITVIDKCFGTPGKHLKPEMKAWHLCAYFVHPEWLEKGVEDALVSKALKGVGHTEIKISYNESIPGWEQAFRNHGFEMDKNDSPSFRYAVVCNEEEVLNRPKEPSGESKDEKK